MNEAAKHLSSAVSLVLCEDCSPKGGYRELLRKIRLARRKVPLVVSSATGGIEQFLFVESERSLGFWRNFEGRANPLLRAHQMSCSLTSSP